MKKKYIIILLYRPKSKTHSWVGSDICYRIPDNERKWKYETSLDAANFIEKLQISISDLCNLENEEPIGLEIKRIYS